MLLLISWIVCPLSPQMPKLLVRLPGMALTLRRSICLFRFKAFYGILVRSLNGLKADGQQRNQSGG